MLSQRPPRPRLTLRIAAFALADVLGLSCFGIGASWLAQGKGAIFADFPTSTAEAIACAAGGAAVMLWAASRILGEIAKQAPELQEKYGSYLASRAKSDHSSADELN